MNIDLKILIVREICENSNNITCWS